LAVDLESELGNAALKKVARASFRIEICAISGLKSETWGTRPLATASIRLLRKSNFF
jgi:hypothetical protein